MSDSKTSFVLLIERGQTRFPERPVDRERFLIGAGSNCQLQLGGDIPILHSIIVPEGEHLWIDAVVPTPPLLVNGTPVRESELHVGDVLEIGGFVFSVAVGRAAAARAIPVPGPQPTASELIEALELEMKGLDEMETGRAAGAAALLSAMAALPAETGTSTSAPAIESERDALIQDRIRELDRREAALEAVAQQLERTQRELHRQIALLAEQLGGQTPSNTNPLKISA